MKNSAQTKANLHSKIMMALSSFAVLIAIAAIFGYSFGKDMALRDNARDATASQNPTDPSATESSRQETLEKLKEDRAAAASRAQGFRPDRIVTPDGLRRLLAGKQIQRLPGEVTPIVYESFAADGTWSSSVEAVMLTRLSGLWEVATTNADGLQLCVTVTERMSDQLPKPQQMCRTIEVSDDRTLVRLAFERDDTLLAIFSLSPIEEN